MKKFLKSFSIYGLIPIFGKFISILLLPLYTRLLTPADYGAQDILVQLSIFLTFLINLEMYAGVGRHFYDRDTLKEKQKLVSTGLWLTVFIGVIVLALGMVFHKQVYAMFFRDDSYLAAYYLAIAWAPISALYTYFVVMMRYEQKPKLYFALVNTQLLIRIGASIICVAGLKMGVKGVIVGHIVGESSAIFMFLVVLRKYIRPIFHLPDLKDVLKFSLPLVPAVLIISFQKPLIRYLVANLLTIEDMGFYTVALQMATILSFVQSGLMMSWQPHLYEMITKPNYESEVKRIYDFFLGIAALVALFIIFNGRLLLKLLTTPAYYPAATILGFVTLNSMLEIVRQISGCGPLVVKKTIYNTYYELVASVAVVLAFVLLHKVVGIVGLAIAFLLGTLVKFIWSWQLTKRFTKINFSMLPTYLLVAIIFAVSVFLAFVRIPYSLGIIVSLLLLALYVYRQRRNLQKMYLEIRHRIPAFNKDQ